MDKKLGSGNVKYRIRGKRGVIMPTAIVARKSKKGPAPTSITASKEIKGNKMVMAKIKQSYREAQLGQTVSLRDLIK